MISGTSRRPLAIAVGVIGLLLLIAAIIWFAEPAKSLPGFMGQISGVTLHRTKHGIAALVAAVACLLVAGLLLSGRAGGEPGQRPPGDTGSDPDANAR